MTHSLYKSFERDGTMATMTTTDDGNNNNNNRHHTFCVIQNTNRIFKQQLLDVHVCACVCLCALNTERIWSSDCYRSRIYMSLLSQSQTGSHLSTSATDQSMPETTPNNLRREYCFNCFSSLPPPPSPENMAHTQCTDIDRRCWTDIWIVLSSPVHTHIYPEYI